MKTKKLIQVRSGILSVLLVLFAFAAVKAATTYTASLGRADFSAFPAVSLHLKIGGDTQGLAARHIAIYENGSLHKGPMAFLPPAVPHKKIDLFILLDRSGNAALYRDVIRVKLGGLLVAMKDDDVDLRIYFSSFGSGDSSVAAGIRSFTSIDAFLEAFDATAFDSAPSDMVYGLEKITSLTTEPSIRNDAEKVLLVLNATPFYVSGEGTLQNIKESVVALEKKGFLPFIVGHPFKSLHSLKTGQNSRVEDSSLSHAIAGGYLGAFSADLTRLYELLKNRDTEHFTLYYISDLLPSQASGASASLFIFDSMTGYVGYPFISETPPVVNHLTASSVLMGDAIPVQVEILPQGKLISEAELSYLTQAQGFQSLLLQKAASKSTPEAQVFEGMIPAGDYPKEGAQYFVKVYTPFDEVGGGEEMVQVGVDQYDDGIRLIPTLVNNEEILWRWEGKTVDMGTQYEIWAGDTMLAEHPETKDRHFTISVTECNRYQIVKVRVLLKSTADHPRAGDWSLFSRPGEVYVPDETIPQDAFTEKFSFEKMVACLKDPAFNTPTSLPGYRPLNKVSLNRQLYYLSAMLRFTALKDLRYERFSLFYFFMDFINQEEFDAYGQNENPIPVKLLYKVITQANQAGDMSALFDEALKELTIRLGGNRSI